MNTNESDARYLSMTLEQVEALPDDELQEYQYAYNRAEREKELAAQNNYAERRLAKSLGFQDEDGELDLLGADFHKIDHAELARSTEDSRAKLQQYYAEEAEKERQQQAGQAAREFLETNPAYVACPQNMAAFEQYLNENKLDVRSVDDLNAVYSALRKQNALVLDPEVVRQEKLMAMQARMVAQALRESREAEAGEIQNLSSDEIASRVRVHEAKEHELLLRRSGLSVK
jgi:SepF-like predicted cell division protein (DUF552 family)